MLWMFGFMFGLGGTLTTFDILDKLEKNQPVQPMQMWAAALCMAVCLICFIAERWLDD